MVGVGENNLGTGIVNLCWRHGFEGAMSSDRHENRRFDCAVRSGYAAAAGTGSMIFSEQFKLQHDMLGFSGAVVAACNNQGM